MTNDATQIEDTNDQLYVEARGRTMHVRLVDSDTPLSRPSAETSRRTPQSIINVI